MNYNLSVSPPPPPFIFLLCTATPRSTSPSSRRCRSTSRPRGSPSSSICTSWCAPSQQAFGFASKTSMTNVFSVWNANFRWWNVFWLTYLRSYTIFYFVLTTGLLLLLFVFVQTQNYPENISTAIGLLTTLNLSTRRWTYNLVKLWLRYLQNWHFYQLRA